MKSTSLFPLSRTLFPGGVLHLRVFEIRYLDMVKRCQAEGSGFGVVTLLSGSEVRTPEGEETFSPLGTLARIDTVHSTLPGLLHLRCVGTQRIRVGTHGRERFGLWTGEVELLDEAPARPVPPALQGSANALGRLIADMQRDGVPASEMPIAAPFHLDECGWVANRWAELLPMSAEEQLALLANDDPEARLARVHQLLLAAGIGG